MKIVLYTNYRIMFAVYLLFIKLMFYILFILVCFNSLTPDIDVMYTYNI